MEISFCLNGSEVAIDEPSHMRLVDLLREKFKLTGTKEGCGQGECGACTVLLDNKAVNSCMVLVSQISGRQVTTIEGLADGETLDPVQDAFVKEGALQCGYCTPGVVMASKGLLLKNPNPDLDEIKNALGGNFCRCTGYSKMVSAIQTASDSEKEAV